MKASKRRSSTIFLDTHRIEYPETKPDRALIVINITKAIGRKIEEVEAFEKAKGEAETLAGFILEIAQQLPVFGQKIIFEKITFTIELVDKKRIKQIKVTLL